MFRKPLRYAMACCVVLACSAVVGAELKLPAMISDNMVLQRGKPLPIWGWAGRGAKVTVTLAENVVAAEADEHCRWQVCLPAIERQERPLEMVVTASSGGTLRVKNILVGEVWLCSGPSNIFWPVN